MLSTSLIVCVSVLALLRLLETALSDFSRSRLERLCLESRSGRCGAILERHDEAAKALRTFALLPWTALATLLWVWANQWPATPRGPWLPAWILGLWALAAAADAWVVRPLGQALAERLVHGLWPLLEALRLLTAPLAQVGAAMRTVAFRVVGREDADDDTPIKEEILTVISDGESRGLLAQDQATMIEGLMGLNRMAVSDIMVPRTDMAMLPLDSTLAEAALQIVEKGHSRVPVYRDDRDHLEGVLYAKDLIPHLADAEPHAPLSAVKLRTPVYVPETKEVDVLLRQFQKERVHIAIVLDEYGGVAGLVTIEDVLEQIVGQIEDEYDPNAQPRIRKLAADVIEVAARIHVDDLNALHPLRLPEDGDFDTLGGFVFSTLGHVPEPGESFDFQGCRYIALEVTDRSISRVRIEMNVAEVLAAAEDEHDAAPVSASSRTA